MPMPPFPRLTPTLLAEWQATIGPDADARVSKQHVVSAVILRRFQDPKRNLLERLSVERPNQNERLMGARGAGVVPDFLAYATVSAEARWKMFEDGLHGTLCAIDGGSWPLSEEHQKILIGIVALHMARNIRYSAIHMDSWMTLVARERDRFLAEPDRLKILKREFLRRYGLHAAGVESLGELYDLAIQEVVDGQMPEKLARLFVEVKFFELLFWLPRASFELLRPKAGEFIIGDSPAVLLSDEQGRFGGVWQLGLGDATHVVLPLGPHLMVRVVLDGESRILVGQIGEAGARTMNEAQVRTANKYVFYRPGGKRREFVRETLRRAQAVRQESAGEGM